MPGSFGTKIFDADQVLLIFMGIPISSGYADGEFCRITPDAPAFTKKVGTDGETTRSKTNQRGATITLRLMQTSSGNAFLSALYNLDCNAPNGAGVGPMLIQDQQGTSLYAASKAWISKRPEVSFDREATEREWTIECADLEGLDGGN